MKNSADLGGCYPPRPSASVDNTLLYLQNSSYPTQPHSIIAKYPVQDDEYNYHVPFRETRTMLNQRMRYSLPSIVLPDVLRNKSSVNRAQNNFQGFVDFCHSID